MPGYRNNLKMAFASAILWTVRERLVNWLPVADISRAVLTLVARRRDLKG